MVATRSSPATQASGKKLSKEEKERVASEQGVEIDENQDAEAKGQEGQNQQAQGKEGEEGAVGADNYGPEEVGVAMAAAAARHDKPNMSARMMLLSKDFWKDMVAAMRGMGGDSGVQPPGGEGTQPPPPESENTPSLFSLDPASLPLDAPDTEVKAVGENFTEMSKIVWNGSEEPTTYIDRNTVSTIVRPSTASGPWTVPVHVDTGGVMTDPRDFSFTESTGQGEDAPLKHDEPDGQLEESRKTKRKAKGEE